MSLVDFLFGGNNVQPTVPTSSDTSTALPLWLQQSAYDISNAALGLGSTPYQPSPVPQVATPSAQTQQSWNLAQNNLGAWQPAVSNAIDLTKSAATPVSAADIDQYMSPFTSNVTDAITKLGNQNLTENILPNINDTFIRAGQFGSSGNTDFTSRAIRDTSQAEANAEAPVLQSGYQGALTAAQAAKAAQQAGGAQLGNLGALTSQLGTQDIGTSAAAGQAQDINAQSNLNAANTQFQNQTQYPFQLLSYINNIVRGLPNTGSTTQTAGTQPASGVAPSPLATFAGTATLGSALGLKKGGKVRRPALSRPMRGALDYARSAA